MTYEVEVIAALDRVVDPCSKAIGTPLGLVAMGLATLTSIDSKTGRVSLSLRLTSPCCAYGPALVAAMRAEVESLSWTTSVHVTIEHGALWSERSLTDAAAQTLNARRVITLALSGAQPYKWPVPPSSTRRAP